MATNPGVYGNTQVGQREDFANWIANVDKGKCPMTAMIPRGSAPTNAHMKWQAEIMSAPNITPIPDGTDVSKFAQQGYRAQLDGFVQWTRQAIFVSKFADNVYDVAGIGKRGEMPRQIRLAGVTVARSIESMIGTGAVDSQQDNGIVGFATRGLGKWNSSTAQGNYPVDANFRPPAAQTITTASTAIGELDIKAMMASAAAAAKGPVDMDFFVGSTLKGALDLLPLTGGIDGGVTSSASTRRIASKEGELVQGVTVIRNGFGTCRIHLSYFLAVDVTPTGNTFKGFMVDTEMLELRYNQMPTMWKLPNGGGGERGAIDAIVGLVVKNPLLNSFDNATA